jgi:hypothetical protein
MNVLGLDPGLDGAAVLLVVDQRPGAVAYAPRPPLVFSDYTIPAPTRGRQYNHARLAVAIREMARFGPEPLCVLEKGRGQPGASSSSLAIGIGFGLLLGIIAANGWRVVMVEPSVWHRALFGHGAKGEPKDRAAAYVRDRLPALDCTLGGRFRKPHPGIVDAAALAAYGMTKSPAEAGAVAC